MRWASLMRLAVEDSLTPRIRAACPSGSWYPRIPPRRTWSRRPYRRTWRRRSPSGRRRRRIPPPAPPPPASALSCPPPGGPPGLLLLLEGGAAPASFLRSASSSAAPLGLGLVVLPRPDRHRPPPSARGPRAPRPTGQDRTPPLRAGRGGVHPVRGSGGGGRTWGRRRRRRRNPPPAPGAAPPASSAALVAAVEEGAGGPQGWRAPPPAPWDAARRRRRRRRRGIDRPPPASWWSCRSSNRETVWGGGEGSWGGGGGFLLRCWLLPLVGLGPRPVRCGRGCVKNCRIRSGTAAPRLRLRVTEEGSTKGMRAKLREECDGQTIKVARTRALREHYFAPSSDASKPHLLRKVHSFIMCICYHYERTLLLESSYCSSTVVFMMYAYSLGVCIVCILYA